MVQAGPPLPPPPEASPRAEGLVRKILGPIDAFLHVEAASGIVLLLATVAAMIWANSSAAHGYHELWETRVSLTVGPLRLQQSIHFLINDGLMVIFFFVVGMEIRREIHGGELSDLRRALLPIVAAVGGMVLPALIYLLLAPGSGAAQRGWGVPMATDIAFAVGVLAVLGKRVAPALRVLLLALAIIDDIGAILVIAIFYSSGLDVSGLVIAGVALLAIVAMQRAGVRHPLLYVVPAVSAWAGVLLSGIHPTIAGVAVGLLTPPRAWLDAQFGPRADQAVRAYQDAGRDELARLDALGHLQLVSREAVSPIDRLVASLHPWVAFGIMPIFALANAGVSLGDVQLDGDAGGVAVATAVALVLGKVVGIFGACALATKVGLARMPSGVRMPGLLVVGLVGGIGFTMSLFIAGLAFGDARFLGAAKLGVLAGSAAAAALGLVAGWVLLRGAHGGAGSAVEAERSTEH